MDNRVVVKNAPYLLRRTQLLPGESLPSLLERLVQLNYYSRLSMLSRICHERMDKPTPKDTITRPNRAQTFLQLAQLTQIPAEALFAASDHRFAPLLSLSGKAAASMPWPEEEPKAMMTSVLAKRCLNPISNARFCPLCLRESPYHHLSWVLSTVAVCLQHQCLLEDRCPRCKRSVSVSEVVNRRCGTCQADLSIAPVVSVAEDTLGILSQKAIQHWLAVAPIPIQLDDCALPQHPPAVLYHMLCDLGYSFLVGQPEWPYLPSLFSGLLEHFPKHFNIRCRLTPRQGFYLYRLAFMCIQDWPHGLFRFLDTYVQINLSAQTSPKATSYPALFLRNWVCSDLQHEVFEFVQQALVEYLLSRDMSLPYFIVECFHEYPWFISRTGLWSGEKAAQVLSIPLRHMYRFYSYNSCMSPLQECLWPGSNRRLALFERDKVLATKLKWESGWSMAFTCRWLGLAQWDIVELVGLGLLKVVRGMEEGDPENWVFDRQSVEAFFDRVDCQLEVYHGCSRDLISLRCAEEIASDMGVGAVALLLGIIDGTLQGYKREQDLVNLAHVRFLEKSATSLPDLLYAAQGLVLGHEFAREIGFAPRVIVEWMEEGLIEPILTFGRYRYFERRSLEQIAARMSSD